ncbi:MAG: hypothetical protein HKN90_01170 [Flavobacteriaceae bacterium]|nr:hypothetical protein [Flavobacteriaceae bacterium]
MKLFLLYLAITCTCIVSAQSQINISKAFEKEKGESFALYENENDDEFRLGISFEDQKGISSSISLLLDDEFADSYTTYSIRDFFVFNVSFVYSLGPFDLLCSIENFLHLNTSDSSLEPINEFNHNLAYLTSYEQEFSASFTFGFTYTF